MQRGSGVTASLLLLMKFSSCFIKTLITNYQNAAPYNQTGNGTTSDTCAASQSDSKWPQALQGLFGSLVAPVLGAVLSTVLGLSRFTRVGGLLLLLPAIPVLLVGTSGGCQSHRLVVNWLGVMFIVIQLMDPALFVMLISGCDARAAGPVDDHEDRDRRCTVLILLFNSVTAIGDLFGTLSFTWWQINRHLVCITLLPCLVFAMCSFCAHSNRVSSTSVSAWSGLRIVWLRRWCQMAVFILLFCCVLLKGCRVTSSSELTQLSGAANSSAEVKLSFSQVPTLMFMVGTGITCAILAGLSLNSRCGVAGFVGRGRRLRAGLTLELTLQAALLVMTATRCEDRIADHPSAVIWQYVAFSLGEGASNALSMVAMFELMVIAAPAGMCIVPFCTAILASNCAAWGIQAFWLMPEGNFYAHYAVGVGLLLLSLLQLNCLTLPLARRMTAAAHFDDATSARAGEAEDLLDEAVERTDSGSSGRIQAS